MTLNMSATEPLLHWDMKSKGRGGERRSPLTFPSRVIKESREQGKADVKTSTCLPVNVGFKLENLEL